MKKITYTISSIILCVSLLNMPIYANEINTGLDNLVVEENSNDTDQDIDDAVTDVEEISDEPESEPVSDNNTPREENKDADADDQDELITYTIEVPGTGEENNDELFEAYVNRAFGIDDGLSQPVIRGLRKSRSTQGSKLTGLEANIYNYLVPKIQQIASGELHTTEFVLSLEDLGLADECYPGANTDENRDAFYDQTLGDIELGSITQALTADFPYEMYWFNKTASTQIFFSLGFTYRNNAIYYNNTTTVTIRMPVSASYQGSGIYQTRNDLSVVNTAVSNAQSIVNECTSYSDYQKLLAYKERICAYTDYNHYAADHSNQVAFGDPWQLIYVFDGDPETTVVCEGYAKAFKYLCDSSTFTGDISCILVTGRMIGATGAGGHMWNIVKMDDGKYYLVDVTNCDTGSVGNPAWLFLKGYTSKQGSVTYTSSDGDSKTSDVYRFVCGSAVNAVDFNYDYNTLSNYSETELAISATDYAAPETCTVTVDKVFFDGNKDVPVDMMGTGSYEKNSSITLTAPEVEGVAFVGWYPAHPYVPYYYYTGDPYTWDREYTFTVTGKLDLVAVYRPTDQLATVAVNCGSKAYTVNGIKYTSSRSFDLGVGSLVTVYTDAPGFKYWKNAYGMVLSRSKSYTFTVSVDDNIEAVFDSSATDKATLIFESEYGQIMGTAKLALNETMSLPTLPTKNSFRTTGWDLNGDGQYKASTDTLNSAIERGLASADRTVVIKAVYETNPWLNIYITIDNGNTIEDYSPAPGELMVAQAGKREGEKFSRWVEDGTGLVLSYNPTYKFYAEERNGSGKPGGPTLSIIAEFVDDDEEVHKRGVTQIVNSYNNSDNNGLVAVSMSTVPEGCRIIKAGIIAVDAEHYPTENRGWITLDTPGVIVRGNSWPGNAYRYTWTRANAQDEQWYVRALLIYEDTSTHEVYTVYGDDIIEMYYSIG